MDYMFTGRILVYTYKHDETPVSTYSESGAVGLTVGAVHAVGMSCEYSLSAVDIGKVSI